MLRRHLVCKALVHLESGFPNISKGILTWFLSFIFTLLQLSLTICCHITQPLVIKIHQLLPCHTNTKHASCNCLPTINLKSTFSKTNNHVIIHSQLIVIRHNSITVTYYTQTHINYLNTYVLVQSSWNKIIGTHTHVMQLIKHSTNLQTYHVK